MVRRGKLGAGGMEASTSDQGGGSARSRADGCTGEHLQESQLAFDKFELWNRKHQQTLVIRIGVSGAANRELTMDELRVALTLKPAKAQLWSDFQVTAPERENLGPTRM